MGGLTAVACHLREGRRGGRYPMPGYVTRGLTARATLSARRWPASGFLAQGGSAPALSSITISDEPGRLNDVGLGADQEIYGIPCLGGTVVWFYPYQSVSSSLSERDIDGIPCASPIDLHLALNFHPNGRLTSAVRARSYVIAGQRYDGGTLVRFDRDGQVIYAQPKATVDHTAGEA